MAFSKTGNAQSHPIIVMTSEAETTYVNLIRRPRISQPTEVICELTY